MREFKNSTDKDFIEALGIYSRNIQPGWKTDTNEITYWVDNYNKHYQSKFGDRFFVVGFYYEDKLIGYAEFVFIKSNKLIIFDYLVVDAAYRSNAVFHQFIDHLRKFIEQEHLNFDYAISEVGYLTDNIEPSKESQLLIRLFKMADGGIVKAPYYQPKLGIENYESQMRGVLLLFSYSKIEQITRETYLGIVEAIYFKHYLRWYEMHQDTSSLYKTEISKLFGRIESETTSMKKIKINGYRFSFDDRQSPEENPQLNILGFLVFSLLLIVFVTFLMLQVQETFRMPLIPFIAIYMLVLVSFFGVMALFSKNALQIFTKLLQFLKIFSRKLR